MLGVGCHVGLLATQTHRHTRHLSSPHPRSYFHSLVFAFPPFFSIHRSVSFSFSFFFWCFLSNKKKKRRWGFVRGWRWGGAGLHAL
ncbi:hypothetical protein TRSC58_07671 [Trypanosoma rangeli SC58]|uniref:Uncharacterized protein n=1 Tax=Trypanosoma rangeli SC58 TaxID=429131 RepID=A0A061IRP8_TRYRA|nr:hypothetical protein TRSC58_07671 [Trypanosoma rangeli SC58]